VYPEHERKLPRLTQADLRRTTDELGRAYFHMQDGRAVCGRLRKAKNRQIPDEACLAPPTARGPCRVHGGRSPGGKVTSGGRYSRALRRWRRPFERALADKEQLDSRRELAMTDVLIERLTARAERGDSPTWRAELGESYDALDEAVRGMKHADIGKCLKELGEKIRAGATGDAARGDLLEQLERRSRMATRLVDLEQRGDQRLTMREVSATFAAFVEVLARTVDPVVMQRLLPQLRAVLPMPVAAPQLIEAGDEEG